MLFSTAIGSDRKSGTQRPDAGDRLDAGQRRGRQERDPQPAVTGEVLLRREVVRVGVGDVDGQAAGRRCGVDGDQRVAGSLGPLHGHRDTGRGFVVRPRDEVDGRIRLRLRGAARVGLDDDGVADERVLDDARGELRTELAVGQMQRALVDQPERRGVPERRRAAVAEDDLVAVGQREQLAQPVADAADEVLHRRLPVRGSEHIACGGQRLQLLRPHLGRPAAEASVVGFEVGGNCQFGHAPSLGSADARGQASQGRRRTFRTARRIGEISSGTERSAGMVQDVRMRGPSAVVWPGFACSATTAPAAAIASISAVVFSSTMACVLRHIPDHQARRDIFRKRGCSICDTCGTVVGHQGANVNLMGGFEWLAHAWSDAGVATWTCCDDTEYVDMLTTLSEGSVRRNFNPYTDIDWDSPEFAVVDERRALDPARDRSAGPAPLVQGAAASSGRSRSACGGRPMSPRSVCTSSRS